MEKTAATMVLHFHRAAAWRARFALLLVVSMSFQMVHQSEATVTQFNINNTASALNISGGIRFQTELGNAYALNGVQVAKQFILLSFNLSKEIPVDLLTLYVDNITGVAYAVGVAGKPTMKEVHLSADYVGSFSPQNTSALQYEITGVLFHEYTHVWQNSNGSYGGDPQFTGVIEGIADYIRLTSGYPAAHWVRAAGGNWFDGYSTTAYFLDWVAKTQVEGFVNQLNNKMATSWTASFFKDITGRDVDQLWQAYQATF